MNKLPIEIQNEIWNIYWKGEFKDRVLDRLNGVSESLTKMDFFLEKHFYFNTSKDYDYKIAHYLRQYNILLNTINKEKGIYLYILTTNSRLALCFNKSYIRSCFSKIADCYKQICVYCLCNAIPNMSYRIIERFNNLSKKI